MFTLIGIGIIVICLLSIDHHIWNCNKNLKKIVGSLKEMEGDTLTNKKG